MMIASIPEVRREVGNDNAAHSDIKMMRDLENFDNTAGNVAVVMATYFHKLVDEGVPEATATQLVDTFSKVWWDKILQHGLDQNKGG